MFFFFGWLVNLDNDFYEMGFGDVDVKQRFLGPFLCNRLVLLMLLVTG